MSAPDRPPWLPEGLSARRVEDAWDVTVPGQTAAFGAIPDDTTVRLSIRDRTAVTVTADDVGRSVRLEVNGPNATVTVPKSFRRVEVVTSPGNATTLRLTGAATNVYVHHHGRVTLNAQDPDEGARCALRTLGDGRHVVAGDVSLHRLEANSTTVLDAALTRDAAVVVRGDLETPRLNVKSARVTGALVAEEIADHTAVEASRVDVRSPRRGRSGTIGAGCQVVSRGDVQVGGQVRGTQDHPSSIVAGDGSTVSITGSAVHCTLSAAPGGVLARADAGALVQAQVVDAATIEIRGAVTASSCRATGPVTIRGTCADTELHGSTVNVQQTATAPTHITGDIITLAETQPDESGELVHVTAGTSATLATPAAATIQPADATADPVQVAVGTRVLPTGEQPVPAEDGRNLDLPPKNAGSGDATLALHGRMIVAVAVAQRCTLQRLSRVEHLLVNGDLTLTGGEADCGTLGVSGVVDLDGNMLSATSCGAGRLVDGRVRATGDLAVQTAERIKVECATFRLSGEGHDLDVTTTGVLNVGAELHGTGQLDAGGHAELHAVSPDTNITLRASARIEGDAPGHVSWSPGEAAAELRLASKTGRLTATAPPGEPAILALGADATIDTADLAGPVSMHVEWPRNGTDASRVDRLTLRDEATVGVDSGSGTLSLLLELAPGHTSGSVHVSGKGRTRFTVGKSGTDGRLTVSSISPDPCVLVSKRDDSSPDDLPATLLTFGRFALDGSHRRVHAGDTVDIEAHGVDPRRHRPVLNLPAGGLVDHISGEFALAACQGRIVGRAPSWRTRAADPPEGPARLLDFDLFRGTEPDALAGTMVNVDVSRIGFAELQRLESLHVFSPLPKPLRDLAKDGSRTTPHDTAQRLTAIAEMTKKRAVSGATRSSALWASTRAHHRTTGGFERVFRQLHRMVGYGQRFLPALSTFLVLLAATALLVAVFEPSSCYDPVLAADKEPTFEHGPYSLGEQVLRVLLVPLGLIRLAATEGQGYAPIFCHPLGQLLVTIVVGLPLVFLLIAIRNYLRSPAD